MMVVEIGSYLMPKLNLPALTLICQETREHKLACLAVEDCVSKIDFGEVLIFTDRPDEFASLAHVCEPRFVWVEDWTDKVGWARFSWFGTPPHIRTPFALSTQWDAGVWDPACWDDKFLDYDFIGAVWPFHNTKKVGNSGFSIKSTRLARYVYSHAQQFPCETWVEDDLLCRKYRPQLEERGFVWAPERIAERFAFECAEPDMQRKHFGYHGCFNWPHVFDFEQVRVRIELMAKSPGLCKGDQMKWLCQKHPDLIKQILSEENLVAAE